MVATAPVPSHPNATVFLLASHSWSINVFARLGNQGAEASLLSVASVAGDAFHRCRAGMVHGKENLTLYIHLAQICEM